MCTFWFDVSKTFMQKLLKQTNIGHVQQKNRAQQSVLHSWTTQLMVEKYHSSTAIGDIVNMAKISHKEAISLVWCVANSKQKIDAEKKKTMQVVRLPRTGANLEELGIGSSEKTSTQTSLVFFGWNGREVGVNLEPMRSKCDCVYDLKPLFYQEPKVTVSDN